MAPIIGQRPDDRWYRAPEFENTATITRIHNYYRFGFSNDFGNVFNDSPAWRLDYAYGIFVISTIIICIFVIWIIALIVLKSMGKQAGCAAGIPPDPGAYSNLSCSNNSSSVDTKNQKQQGTHVPGTPVSFNLLRGGSFFRYPRKGNSFRSIDSRVSGRSSGMSTLTHNSSTRHLSDAENLLMKHIEGIDGGDQGTVARRRSTLESNNLSVADETELFRLSELPEAVTEEPSSDEIFSLLNDGETDDLKRELAQQKLTRVRFAFLICSTGVIISSAILVYHILSLFQDTFTSTENAANEIVTHLNESIFVTNEYLVAQFQTRNAFSDISNSILADWCPSPQLSPLQEEVDEVRETIEVLGDLLGNEILNINMDLYNIRDAALSSRIYFDYMNVVLDMSIVISALIVVVTILFMIGVLQARLEKSTLFFSKVQTYFFLPFFIASITFTCFSCCIFMVTMLVSSDFCINSPEKKVILILDEKLRGTLSPIVQRLIRFYVEGCSETLVADFTEFDTYIVNAIERLHDFIVLLSRQDPVKFQEMCGIDLDDVLRHANTLDAAYHKSLTILFKVQAIFTCSSFNQLYVDLIYDGLCYSGTRGLEHIFLLSLAIVWFGGIVITLRVSWRQSRYGHIIRTTKIPKPERKIQDYDDTLSDILRFAGTHNTDT